MFNEFVSCEQIGVPNQEQLTTRMKADPAKEASRGWQEPWSANGEVPTALMVASSFIRQELTSFLEGTRFHIVTAGATLTQMGAFIDGRSRPPLIIAAPDDAAGFDALCAMRTAHANAKLVILVRSDAL